jgi:beta-lactamase regulating signal transducer with metallopeptidase domain
MSDLHNLNGWVGFAALVTLQATFLLTAAWLGARALRRRPAAERHLVWSVAVAGVIALPLLVPVLPTWQLSVPLPAWTVAADKAAASNPVTALAVPAAPALAAPELAAPVLAAPVLAGANPMGAVGLGSQHETLPATEAAAALAPWMAAPPAGDGAAGGQAHSPSAGMLALRIWLAGVLAMGVVILLGLVHVHVLARRAAALRDPALAERASRIAAELGVKRPVRLLQGGPDAMPMTFGLLRATLLLPSSAGAWPPARQDAVLRHELAHIRRRDSLTQLLADIGCALYWFHPLMWVAARQLRVEREHACDDVVLVSGARATDYASELLQIARTMRTRRLTARVGIAMAQPTRLRTRIAAVLEDRSRAGHLSDRLLVPCWIGALALITTVAAVAPAPASARTGMAGDATSGVPTSSHAQPGYDAAVVAVPVVTPLEPLSAPVQPVSASGEPDCWESSQGYSYSRTVDDGVRTQFYLSHQTLGDTRICVRATGSIPFDEQGAQLEGMSAGDRLLLASRTSSSRQTLEIVRTDSGFDHAWFVDGIPTPFDDTAREWRDAMLDVVGSYEGINRVRGEVARLRGDMARVRGGEARLRGDASRIRGEEARLRGEIARIRGEETRLRGDASRIRGDDARLRSEISRLQSRVSSLERTQRTTQDAQTLTRLVNEVAETTAEIERAERWLAEHDTQARLREVERRIAEYDAARRIQEVVDRVRTDTADRVREIDGRIADYDAASMIRAIEEQIEALDADARISQIRQRLEPQERRLQEILRRIR